MATKSPTKNKTRKPAQTRAKRLSANHQRYAAFAVELLLNDDDSVRRTKVSHVQSGESKTWAEWSADEAVAFIESKAGLQKEAASSPQADILPAPPVVKKTEAPHIATALSENMANVSMLGVVREGETEFNHLLSSDQTYKYQLALEVTDEEIARGASLKYQAVVQAKLLGTGKILRVGASSGMTHAGKRVVIDVNGNKLGPGTYRLGASVMLRNEGGRGKTSEVSVWQDGGLLSVY
jgi:hypothetical protein